MTNTTNFLMTVPERHICAACGYEESSMDARRNLQAHVETCSSHPLAAARADADRLAKALERAAVSGCHMTSGGTDGVWCIDHDAPWAEPESRLCTDGVLIDEALRLHGEPTP